MRLPHLLHAGRSAAVVDDRARWTHPDAAPSDDAPEYVWPMNPWGGYPFRPARA